MFYIALGIIALLGLRTVLKYRSLTKKVNYLNDVLYLEKNPEEYISQCDKLLGKSSGKRDRDLNLILKSTGLFYAGRFEEVIRILESDLNKIPSGGQFFYYQNLVLSSFFGGDLEKGTASAKDATDALGMYKRNENNDAGVEFIFAVADLYSGDFEGRKEFFKDLSENGRNDYRIAMSCYCLGLIYKNEGDFEAMNLAFDRAVEHGKNSFVIKLVENERNGVQTINADIK